MRSSCRQQRSIWLLLALAISLLAVQGAMADGKVKAPPPTVDAAFFIARIQPLLQKNCLGCHGVGARLSGLDLRSRASALQGGTRGPAITPGSAQKSLLYKLVSGVRAPSMPP